MMGAGEGKSTGTGKWREPGIPHKGWQCIGIEDCEGSENICEMCEWQTIRYVHEMVHDDFPGSLFCGCVCAGNMEQDLEGAKRRERGIKNRSKRKENWINKRWRISEKGNQWCKVKGFHVVIWAWNGWNGSVSHEDTGQRVIVERCATEEEAKLGCLDIMEDRAPRGGLCRRTK